MVTTENKKIEEEILKKGLFENKQYFDELFKDVDKDIMLDDQQRKAILLDADNLLVIAGAGAGKTTTMVAKVKYLVDKCGYKQSEIAVLSFTKKVKEEMEKMLYDKFGLKGVSIFTFHSLGLKILKDGGENVNGIADDRAQYKIFSNYIKEQLFTNKDKFKLFTSAFGKHVSFGNEWERFASFKEYHDYKYNFRMKNNRMDIKAYNENQILIRRNYKKTIKGEYVLSKEEVDIANFLYKNGIEYVYEKKYEECKHDYHPDFYIYYGEQENYIEHFGVDQNGYNGMYTDDQLKDYLKNLKIKTSFHNQESNRGLFIVTYSKYSEGDYLGHLEEQLIEKGYQLFSRTEEEIYDTLKDTSQDGYCSKFIDKLLIPFISLYKQCGYELKDFEILINETDGVLKEQLYVMHDFFAYYEKELKEKRLVDFEDMITSAYRIIPTIKEKNLGVDYKYLIIDEYQDISSQRLNLVKELSELFDAKIMAVGDDWQSIFGYSGARVELFKDFEKYLKNAKSIPIENTYRNSQELIDIAGDFILKNKSQIEKRLKSRKHIKNPVEVFVYDDSNIKEADINKAKTVDKIIESIYQKNPNDKILLIGRYNRDIYSLKNDYLFTLRGDKVTSKKNPKAKLSFLTIHKAKGLGYDQCILLNLSDDTYGFPSRIEDEPIVKLIKPKNKENIDYPEERRLFYVALTRTKKRVSLLVPKSKASSFAEEIGNYANVSVHYINW